MASLTNIPEPAFEIARDLFELLEKHTGDGVGITRASYGEGEQFAHDAVTKVARAEGLEVATDVAGNLYITLPGHDRSDKVSIIGSHLDSVPTGGNFDGAAGVLAGLATIVGWKRGGFHGKGDVTVMAIRAEESNWFPYSYVGSKAAFGILPAAALDVRRSDSGRSLAEHIADLGFEPEAVRRGEAYLDPQRLRCYIELHIEQGPVLVEQKQPVAAVSGIRGSFRYREARIIGEHAHSGAVPRAYRHDAVAAGAELVSRLNAEWRALEAQGKDLTVTFGIFATNPALHAFSKIAGEVDFCVDVRSHDVAVLADMQKRLHTHVAAIESELGVSFELGPLTDSQPALMSAEMLSLFEQAAGETGTPYVEMACGAGHDAAVFAQRGVPTAMLLIRNEGGSHNPDEQMDFEDFAVGTRLMARALARIA